MGQALRQPKIIPSRADGRAEGSYCVAYLELELISTSTGRGGAKEKTLRNAA